jgi:hypothetical protein
MKNMHYVRSIEQKLQAADEWIESYRNRYPRLPDLPNWISHSASIHESIAKTSARNLTIIDILSGMKGNWYSDDFLYIGLSMLCEGRKNVIVAHSGFLNQLFSGIQKRGVHSGYSAEDTEFILLPRNQNSKHWSIVIVHLKEDKIILYDGLSSDGLKKTELDAIEEWLSSVVGRSFWKSLSALLVSPWKHEVLRPIKQKDSHSCGPITIFTAALIALNGDFVEWDGDEVEKNRILILEMIAGHHPSLSYFADEIIIIDDDKQEHTRRRIRHSTLDRRLQKRRKEREKAESDS